MQEDVEPPRGTVSTTLDEPAQTLQKKAPAAHKLSNHSQQIWKI